MPENILVVDDEECVRSVYSRVLTKAGYSVITSTSGQEALEKLKGNSISLILTDAKMPRMDGYELTERIKKEYPRPVIMTSGTPDEEKARQYGVDLLLIKPVDFKDLVDAIERVLENYQSKS